MNQRETRKSYLSGIECKHQSEFMSDLEYWWDPVCGIYAIETSVIHMLDGDSKKKRELACVLAQRKIRGYSTPIKIFSTTESITKKTEKNFVVESVDRLLQEYPQSPLQMLEEAFYNFSLSINHPSELIKITADRALQFYMHDDEARIYIINQFQSMGLIDHVQQTSSSSSCQISARGWQYLAELHSKNGIGSNQAFIAMWFDPSMTSYFEEGISKAVSDECGYVCRRIDLKEHNNKICDEIVAEIRRSKFVVADFSGNRGGVYYEAGFAHGLGIPVIWTVHKDHLDSVHFDTRQYNHIVYDSPETLRKMLTNRIKSTIY